jgi:hypothetical protein
MTWLRLKILQPCLGYLNKILNFQSNLKLMTLKTLMGFIIILSACTEKIDVGVENMAPMLVVNADFTTEKKVHVVKLNTTSSFSQTDDPAPVSNAIVRIMDESDTFLLKENPINTGVYETQPDVAGKEKHTYHLLISNVDINKDGLNEEYSASEYMNTHMIVDSIKVLLRNSPWRGGDKSWRVLLFAQEPQPLGNCYLFLIKKNGILLTDSLEKYRVQYDYEYNGNYLDSLPIFRLEKTKKDSVNIGDTITLECGSTTIAYTDFIYNTQNLIRGSNPLFGGPSANVWGNILPLGKAIGYFAVYSVYKVDCVYKGEIEKNPD